MTLGDVCPGATVSGMACSLSVPVAWQSHASTRRWAHGTQLVNALERCASQQGDDEDAVAKLRGFASRSGRPMRALGGICSGGHQSGRASY